MQSKYHNRGLHPFSCEGLERANSVYFDLKSIQSPTCGNQGFFRENRTQQQKLAAFMFKAGMPCLPVANRGLFYSFQHSFKPS